MKILRIIFWPLITLKNILDPNWWAERIGEKSGAYDKAKNSFARNRIITDYIAGMTDRFAINEHKKLYDFNKGW